MMGYPKRTPVARPQPNIAAQAEQVQALTGALGASAGKEAITRENVGALGQVKIKSRYASAAPTQAEYNALVDDMKSIASLLNSLGADFSNL
jgi:hypothetical protein